MSVGDDVHGSGRCHNGKHEKKGTYDRSKSGHDQKRGRTLESSGFEPG